MYRKSSIPPPYELKLEKPYSLLLFWERSSLPFALSPSYSVCRVSIYIMSSSSSLRRYWDGWKDLSGAFDLCKLSSQGLFSHILRHTFDNVLLPLCEQFRSANLWTSLLKIHNSRVQFWCGSDVFVSTYDTYFAAWERQNPLQNSRLSGATIACKTYTIPMTSARLRLVLGTIVVSSMEFR